MPGKQMSIDAELNAGIIDDNQPARDVSMFKSRQIFMAPWMTPVNLSKGIDCCHHCDVVNIWGFVIGMVMGGLSFQEALQHYALLTVGADLPRISHLC